MSIQDKAKSIRIMSTDIYTENISTVGWAWRHSDQLSSLIDINTTRPIIVRVKKCPEKNYTFTLLTVYYSKVNISGTIKANFTFVIFNVSYVNAIPNKDKVNPNIHMISWFNITADVSEYPRITHTDFGWINANNITVVYSYENREFDATLQIYKNKFWIKERFLNTSSGEWSNEVLLLYRTDYGYVKGIAIASNSTDLGYSQFVTYSYIIVTYTSRPGGGVITTYDGYYRVQGLIDISKYVEWAILKAPIDTWLSKPIINSSKIYSALCAKHSEGDSDLYLLITEYSSGTLSGPQAFSLVNTESYAEERGIYADFKEPSITILEYNSTNEALLVIWIAYTSLEQTIVYSIFEVTGNKLTEIREISDTFTPSKPSLILSNRTSTEISLLWLDNGLGAKEVAFLAGIWNSSTKNFIWSDKTYATTTNTVTSDYDYTTSCKDDIVLVHLSQNTTGFKEVFLNMGYNDSDKDGLGNWEEVNIYGTDLLNPDTDSDGINDGAEVLIYGTSPSNNDTDGDHLTDKFELEKHESTINKYQTDPLAPDTDNDNLTDYEEIYGEFYNKTKIWGYQTNPLEVDTDNDGLSDYSEIIIGTEYWINSTTNTFTAYPNATRADSDSDGIKDIDERDYKTNPTSNDTDGDSLSDYNEIKFYYTDPRIKDCDKDGLTDYQEIINYSTDPLDNDTDNDGLTDYQEVEGVFGYNTDPLSADTDNDGLTDGEEISLKTNPLLNDTDRDQLSDLSEIRLGTDPLDNDTDSDSILDGLEIHGVNISGLGVRYTDPKSNDTDGDGLSDYDEAFVYLTDPTLADTDGDGLNDYRERVLTHSDPLKADTDGDGLSDYDEFTRGSNLFSNDTDGDGLDDYTETLIGTDLLLNDTDRDGLLDGQEYNGVSVSGIGVVKTDPLLSDTDKDGLADGDECLLYKSNPLLNDTDGDGLSDYDEAIIYSTNIFSKDTDKDGLNDYIEVKVALTDPLLNDTDGDGLLDGQEYSGLNISGLGVRYTDPKSNDTDGDGLSDYDEAFVYLTDPTLADTDGDGLNDYRERVLTHSDPLKADTDGDGLSDYDEFTRGSNLFSNDTDGDGLDDYTETLIGTDLLLNDTDRDGLLDGQEYVGVEITGAGVIKTDPLDSDTDGDGLLDGEEVLVYHTNPVIDDTDGDGLSDYSEVALYHTDPVLGDSDNDGLNDYLEVMSVLSDPLSNDTDGDGLLDGEEYFGLNISGLGVRKTSPILNDTDGDNITDYSEVIKYKTDPTQEDTDGDALSDYYELFVSYTSPVNPDSDNDGLTDYEEIKVFHTNALDPDSDNDGLNDYVEVKGLGTNPLNPDTDGDGIPDNVDILFPSFKDETLIFVVLLTILLAYAVRYGVFRSWRKDIVAIGLADLGGTPMFVMPDEISALSEHLHHYFRYFLAISKPLLNTHLFFIACIIKLLKIFILELRPMQDG